MLLLSNYVYPNCAAKVAVFVGQRCDARGGDDGTLRRRTPWGEMTWLLAGDEGYAIVAEHDKRRELQIPGLPVRDRSYQARANILALRAKTAPIHVSSLCTLLNAANAHKPLSSHALWACSPA